MKVKKLFKFNPRSVKTDEFYAKIKAYIKVCAAFHYPETKGDYEPDFSKPIFLEKNLLRVWKDYHRALRQLRRLDIKVLSENYRNLSDEYSKEMMLKVLAYNCFADPRLRFPVFYSPHLQMGDIINGFAVDDSEMRLCDDLVKLRKLDISKLGYNLTLWHSIIGTAIDFVQEQYKYRNLVEAEPGDVVIDAGACYGDTALYFSEKTKGADIYSFEFLPENLAVFNKNVELNPRYKSNIHLVESPIGDVSGDKLYAVPSGPGTSVSSIRQPNAIELETVSIDDFVERNHIQKVDFIKMDIEGSEEAALRGAAKTIRKFKPKLAICAYHKLDDLCVLPKLIKELVPEYRMYLDHFTINFTETVLFAKV